MRGGERREKKGKRERNKMRKQEGGGETAVRKEEKE